jgi:hypothetical protein
MGWVGGGDAPMRGKGGRLELYSYWKVGFSEVLRPESSLESGYNGSC